MTGLVVITPVLTFIIGVIAGYYLTRKKAPQLDANDRLGAYEQITGGKEQAEMLVDMALLRQRNQALEERIRRALERGLDV